MAARIPVTRVLARASAAASLPSACLQRRTFSSTGRMLETSAAALPARKPVGGFRGGLFGFLLGAVSAGTGMYYYVVQEYKVSNELLTEDIYNLQATVQRIEGYVRVVEDKVDTATKKK